MSARHSQQTRCRVALVKAYWSQANKTLRLIYSYTPYALPKISIFPLQFQLSQFAPVLSFRVPSSPIPSISSITLLSCWHGMDVLVIWHIKKSHIKKKIKTSLPKLQPQFTVHSPLPCRTNLHFICLPSQPTILSMLHQSSKHMFLPNNRTKEEKKKRKKKPRKCCIYFFSPLWMRFCNETPIFDQKKN